MKATELMIGDWVSDKAGSPMQVASIFIETVILNFSEVNERDLKEIPISSEILEKNGFIKQENNWHNKFGFPFVISNDKDEYDLSILSWDDDDDLPIFSIKWVHELQHVFKLIGIKKDIVL